jgi:uncharacterized protein (TIGR02646 family)
MRTIIKGREPNSLTHHRATDYASYDNYSGKERLRVSLISEQRGLCCYCLSRISVARGVKIEHWHSQRNYPDEQINYSNLLAACMGNEGQRRVIQHCDTYKGDRELWRNPADPTHHVEDLIRFEGDGTIVSDNPIFNAQINQVLNLNVPFLRNSRKASLDALKATLVKRGTLPRATLERWLRDWNGESHTDELQPFCQVIVYWLRKRLARA